MSNKSLGTQIVSLLKDLKEVLAVLGLYFGSLITFFDEIDRLIIDNKIIRMFLILLIPLFIVLLIKVILSYKEKKTITSELEKRSKNDINYKYELIKREIVFEPDGSNVDSKNFIVTVLKDKLLSLYDETVLWTGNKVFSFDVEFTGTAEESEVNFKKLIDNREYKYYLINFSPALKVEKKATYTIKETAGAGLFSMTLDDISERMKTDKWPIHDIAECIRVPIHVETGKLIIKVFFPIDFHISGEEFFDVTLFRSPNRYNEEYERIEKEKYFKQTYDFPNGKRILILEVPQPKEGLDYWIKWQPPLKNDYEKFLENIKINKNIN